MHKGNFEQDNEVRTTMSVSGKKMQEVFQIAAKMQIKEQLMEKPTLTTQCLAETR